MPRDRTQKQMVLPTTQNQNIKYSNQSPTRGGCCGVLRCVHDSFYWMHETRKGGASWLFVWDLAANTNRSNVTQHLLLERGCSWVRQCTWGIEPPTLWSGYPRFSIAIDVNIASLKRKIPKMCLCGPLPTSTNESFVFVFLGTDINK